MCIPAHYHWGQVELSPVTELWEQFQCAGGREPGCACMSSQQPLAEPPPAEHEFLAFWPVSAWAERASAARESTGKKMQRLAVRSQAGVLGNVEDKGCGWGTDGAYQMPNTVFCSYLIFIEM